MFLAFKLKQSDLAEQIQTAGELNDRAYKLKGDKWVGFTIGTQGKIMGFVNDELTSEFSKNTEAFGNIKTGSFVVMELRDYKTTDGKREETWDVYLYQKNQDGKYFLEKNPVLDFITHLRFSIFHTGGNLGKIRKKKNKGKV